MENLEDIVEHLRVSILDDIGGTGVDWSSFTESTAGVNQFRWTNEELVRYINEARRQVIRRALPIRDASTSAIVNISIDTTTSPALYKLDTRIIRVIQAKLASDNKWLQRDAYENYIHLSNYFINTGTPSYWIDDYENGKILLDRVPETADTLNMVVHRLPLEDLSWTSKSEDEIEVPSEWWIDMLDYAAHLAYLKDQVNTFDPTRANYFLGKFSSNFPPTSATSEVQKRRNKRPVRYGGYTITTRRTTRNTYGRRCE